jgi:hypothetical protein
MLISVLATIFSIAHASPCDSKLTSLDRLQATWNDAIDVHSPAYHFTAFAAGFLNTEARAIGSLDVQKWIASVENEVSHPAIQLFAETKIKALLTHNSSSRYQPLTQKQLNTTNILERFPWSDEAILKVLKDPEQLTEFHDAWAALKPDVFAMETCLQEPLAKAFSLSYELFHWNALTEKTFLALMSSFTKVGDVPLDVLDSNVQARVYAYELLYLLARPQESPRLWQAIPLVMKIRGPLKAPFRQALFEIGSQLTDRRLSLRVFDETGESPDLRRELGGTVLSLFVALSISDTEFGKWWQQRDHQKIPFLITDPENRAALGRTVDYLLQHLDYENMELVVEVLRATQDRARLNRYAGEFEARQGMSVKWFGDHYYQRWAQALREASATLPAPSSSL